MIQLDDRQLDDLIDRLDDWGLKYDRSGSWPARSVALLGEVGGWTWNVPAEHGGRPLAHPELLRMYGALATGCMSTALISTQRDGAVELLATSSNDGLKQELLPRFARGELFTTVGISQLTTSRRGGGNLLTARRDGSGYRLDGMMPWATGAEHADWIVTGAVLPDGQQFLACVPTAREGLQVREPDELMTLTASRTSCVACKDFFVSDEEVIRGPAERVLKLRTPVKPLVTSTCGLGVAAALQRGLAALEPQARAPFAAELDALDARAALVRRRLLDAAGRLNDAAFEVPSTRIRVQVNEIVVRLALAVMVVAKGSGFLLDRHLQRHVREAFFFLVWSAPTAVQHATLQRLLTAMGDDTAELADL